MPSNSRSSLRPSRAGRGCVSGQHLSGALAALHVLGAAPLLGDHEQRSSVLAAEDAGKAASVELDRLRHLASFADAHAVLVADIGIPDGAVCVETDPVGMIAGELGPRSPLSERSEE